MTVFWRMHRLNERFKPARHAATPAAMRLTVAHFGLAFLMTIGSAEAGDFASVEIHGFSEDGSRFVFEQYGIHDGSGAPYSELFAIDVVKDAWIKPSPVKFAESEVPDETDFDALLDDTRHLTLQSASEAGLLDDIAPRGQTVGSNPATELNADPHHMVVNPRAVVPPVDKPLEFAMEVYPMQTEKCTSYALESFAFRLSVTQDGKTRVLNNDTSLPDSRGCPQSYRIERVITYFPEGGQPVFAVLVQKEQFGFEGPDGRFLAITGTF